MTSIDFLLEYFIKHKTLIFEECNMYTHNYYCNVTLYNVTMNRMQNCKYNYYYSLNIKNSEVQIFRE